MSATERVDKRLDKGPLAHRLPTLIHPGSTLRRGKGGAYPFTLYSNRLIKHPRTPVPLANPALSDEPFTYPQYLGSWEETRPRFWRNPRIR